MFQYTALFPLFCFIECYLYVKQNTSSNDNTTASLKSPCYTSVHGSTPLLQFEYHKPFWDRDGWFIYIHILLDCASNDLSFVDKIDDVKLDWKDYQLFYSPNVSEVFSVSKIEDIAENSKMKQVIF